MIKTTTKKTVVWGGCLSKQSSWNTSCLLSVSDLFEVSSGNHLSASDGFIVVIQNRTYIVSEWLCFCWIRHFLRAEVEVPCTSTAVREVHVHCLEPGLLAVLGWWKSSVKNVLPSHGHVTNSFFYFNCIKQQNTQIDQLVLHCAVSLSANQSSTVGKYNMKSYANLKVTTALLAVIYHLLSDNFVCCSPLWLHGSAEQDKQEKKEINFIVQVLLYLFFGCCVVVV